MKGVPKVHIPKKPGLHLPKIGLSTKAISKPSTASILKRIGGKKGKI